MYFLIEQQWFYRAYLFICFAFPEKRQQFLSTVYKTVNKPFFVTWKNPSKKTRSPFSLEIQSNSFPLLCTIHMAWKGWCFDEESTYDNKTKTFDIKNYTKVFSAFQILLLFGFTKKLFSQLKQGDNKKKSFSYVKHVTEHNYISVQNNVLERDVPWRMEPFRKKHSETSTLTIFFFFVSLLGCS